MRTSKGSSTPARTSPPAEAEILRAIAEIPFWSDEPIATRIAERLGATPRAIRPMLEGIAITMEVPGALLGRIEESWLFRLDASKAPLTEQVAGIDGVVAADVAGPYAIVRTLVADAVHRERVMRALHQRLAERPLAELWRPARAPPKRKLARADWTLIAALREVPTRGIGDLGVPPRTAKERLPKLVEERALTLAAAPRAEGVAIALARMSPSSSHAARDALARFGDALLAAFIPEDRDVRLADALLLRPTPEMRSAAADVPGVASVEVWPVAKRWRDDAAIDALVKKAGASAAP